MLLAVIKSDTETGRGSNIHAQTAEMSEKLVTYVFSHLKERSEECRIPAFVYYKILCRQII